MVMHNNAAADVTDVEYNWTGEGVREDTSTREFSRIWQKNK